MRILLLSHSDVTVDSRILKAQLAAKNNGFEALALGVSIDGTIGSKQLGALSIKISSLLWRNSFIAEGFGIGYVIGRLTYLVMYAEILAKFTLHAISFKPKIVHCNDWLVLPISLVICQITGAKLLYDAHELESDTNQLPSKMKKLIGKVERVCWRKVDFFVTVSGSIQNWYLDTYGPKTSEVILNSPVFRGTPKKADATYLRRRFGIPAGKKIFVYVGQICPGRGVETILNVFKSPSLNSAIVFLGDGDSTDLVKTASEECENVYLHSPVVHSEVVEVISSADAGICLIENVSLSDFMSLPNKVFEYAFAGLPIIASDFPELSNAVLGYKLGKVIKPSPELLLGAVLEIERNAKLSSGPPNSLLPLSWEEQERKLVDIYRRLAKVQ